MIRRSVTAGDTTIGTPLHDPKTGDLFVSGLGFLARIDAATGRTRWRRPMTLPWNPAVPVAANAGIAAIDAGHGVVLLDRDTGDALWQTRIDGDAPFAMSSYQRTPHPLFASPALLGDRLLVPGLDARLHQLDVATGTVTAQVPLGTPVAAVPVVAGNLVLLVGTDGGVLALDAERLR